MDSTTFRSILEHATIEELGQIIDWVQRPWAPQDNDRLRRAWHEAGRDPSHRARLVDAVEREIAGLCEADLAHVARALGHLWTRPTRDDVLRLVAGRLTRRAAEGALWPLLGVAVRAAGMLLEACDFGGRPRPSRARGRRRRHHGRH